MLFPGLDVFLRIDGRGRVCDDAALLDLLSEGGKRPKTALVVTVEQVLFHCGKAINRARLWAPDARVGRGAVLSVGAMKSALSGGSATDAERLDAECDQAVRKDPY